MKTRKIVLAFVLFLGLTNFYWTPLVESSDESRFVSKICNLKTQDLKFYWRNDKGKRFGNFKVLKDWLEDKEQELVFAMNGGMYLKDGSPQGLYIEDGTVLHTIDTIQEAYGNFYLQPNGIFYITKDKKPVVCTTDAFKSNGNVKYATQSGPMLLIDGQIHPKFIEGSTNLHIRNGVGVLPNGSILFAISTEEVNFFDFASYFKNKGCNNALYLDGFVSRMYLPAKNQGSLDGNFGVIIGEVKEK